MLSNSLCGDCRPQLPRRRFHGVLLRLMLALALALLFLSGKRRRLVPLCCRASEPLPHEADGTDSETGAIPTSTKAVVPASLLMLDTHCSCVSAHRRSACDIQDRFSLLAPGQMDICVSSRIRESYEADRRGRTTSKGSTEPGGRAVQRALTTASTNGVLAEREITHAQCGAWRLLAPCCRQCMHAFEGRTLHPLKHACCFSEGRRALALRETARSHLRASSLLDQASRCIAFIIAFRRKCLSAA